MSFSYTLFLALLLIAPGLALWAGIRLGERSDLVSQAPEKPGSTFNLFAIVFGALLGHMLMSGAFAAQSLWCQTTELCVSVTFDPNVYRAIIKSEATLKSPADIAVFWWFLSLLSTAVVVGFLGRWLAGRTRIQKILQRVNFGWLYPIVQDALPANRFILAYVVTSLEHEGANVSYEGVVEHVALDESRAITMIALSSCDKFLVKISASSVKRIDIGQTQIPLLQLCGDKIVNVALEIMEDESTPAS